MRGTGQGPSKPNSLLAALAPRDAPPAEAADARGTLATAIVFVAGAEVDWRAGEDLSVAVDGACTRARGFGRDPVLAAWCACGCERCATTGSKAPPRAPRSSDAGRSPGALTTPSTAKPPPAIDATVDLRVGSQTTQGFEKPGAVAPRR